MSSSSLVTDIRAHITGPSANKPPLDPSHHARPPVTDQLGRPHRCTRSASWTWTWTWTGTTEQHSTARHDTKPTRGWGRGRRPSGPQLRRMRFHHGVLQPHHKQGPAPPAALRRGPLTHIPPARPAGPSRSLQALCCPSPLPLLSLLISPLSLIHRPWSNRRLFRTKNHTLTNPADPCSSCLYALLTRPAGAVVIGTGAFSHPRPSFYEDKPGPLWRGPVSRKKSFHFAVKFTQLMPGPS